jgi:hypothetical protein
MSASKLAGRARYGQKLIRAGEGTANPKSEIRNPKQIRNPTEARLKTAPASGVLDFLPFRLLNLFRISGFGFRISEFSACGGRLGD